MTKSSLGEKTDLPKASKEGLLITWRHVNFSAEKRKDSIGFHLPEIVGWKMEKKPEQEISLTPLETEDYQKSYETFLPFGDF